MVKNQAQLADYVAVQKIGTCLLPHVLLLSTAAATHATQSIIVHLTCVVNIKQTTPAACDATTMSCKIYSEHCSSLYVFPLEVAMCTQFHLAVAAETLAGDVCSTS